MDIVDTIVYDTLARRALLQEQWIERHLKCAGESGVSLSRSDTLLHTMKCVCGSNFTITITIDLIAENHESNLFKELEQSRQ